MNLYRKGRAKEYASMRLLEAAGYQTFRMAGSHSPCDVIGVSPTSVRLIQVKAGKANASPAERETFRLIPCPGNCTKEIWRWKDRAREPLIERVG